MADDFRHLLDATIDHVQTLKARGQKSAAVRPETLAALGRPAPRRPASSPAPTARASVPAQGATARQSTTASAPGMPAASGRRSVAGSETGAPGGAATTAPATGKAAALAALRAQALACTRCPHLVASRTQVVFGVGSANAELMFVGEAPGADEDAQGEPFVGAAGQLLTRIIEAMNLTRQDVYIGNILKCRPDTPGQDSGNRKPRPEEMQTCIPWLHQQIDLIQPRVLVALGATAVEGLLGKTIGISKLRGNWRTYRNIPLMPTYHPAYLLRNQSQALKREVWEDMLQVMEKLGLPITAKQRGFFLKK